MSKKRMPSALPIMHRAAKIDAPPPKDGERRSGPDPGRFEFAVSSEEPVRRWFGDEVLLHNKENVRTGRLDEGQVPALFNHDPNQQLGIVDSYTLKDGVLRVSGPFGPSPFAQEKRADYDAGILKSASVGYKIHTMVRTITEDDGDDTEQEEDDARCEVRDWEPFDASLVTIPADYTVGAGRAEDAGQEFPVQIETITLRSAAAAAAPVVEVTHEQPTNKERTMAEPVKDQNAEAQAELARRSDIMATATDPDFRSYVSIDDAQKAIADNTPAEKFRDLVARKIVAANNVDKVGTAGDNLFQEMDKRDQKRYSVFRLVRSMVQKDFNLPASMCDATLEREYSAELAKRLKISTAGILIPANMQRALGTQGAAAGSGQLGLTSEAAAVSTITQPEVIELLRNRPRVEQLGARHIGGLQGVVKFPRQSAAASAQWVGEGASTTSSDLAMDSVAVTPHRISAQTAWTIELLAETSPDVEGLARADQDKVIQLALDLAALSGSGGVQPTGLLATSGLALLSPSGTAQTSGGNALSWADILAFEATVAAANADSATSAWMFTPEVRSTLKATPKFASGYAVPIWNDGPKDPLGIDTEGPAGYRAAITNQLSKVGTKSGVTGSVLHTGVFGDWSQLVIADWGAREIVVDPYTQAGNAAVVVTQRALYDVMIRHIAAFVANPYIAVK